MLIVINYPMKYGKNLEVSLTDGGKCFSQLTRAMCSGLSWDWRNQIRKGHCRVPVQSHYLMWSVGWSLSCPTCSSPRLKMPCLHLLESHWWRCFSLATSRVALQGTAHSPALSRLLLLERLLQPQHTGWQRLFKLDSCWRAQVFGNQSLTRLQ